MILVTVGTHNQPFDRLIKAVDELIGERKMTEKTIMQIGHSNYIPANSKWYRFIDMEKMNGLIKESDIIITHSGIGTVLTALKFNKRIVLVPRLKKFNEHSNDHQLQIAKKLDEEKKALVVYDIKDLYATIESARKFNPKRHREKSKILLMISKFIADIER